MFPLSRLPNRTRTVLSHTLLAAAVGVIYSEINGITRGGSVLLWAGAARGAIAGATIACILTSLEVFVLAEPVGARFRQAPFLVHMAVKTLVYLLVILFGLTLGAWPFLAPGERAFELRDVAFGLIVSFIFVFIFDLNRLLGQNVLLNFLTGRYHHPRLEERVFLLIDMQGSTGFAERLGELAFHRLVNRFVVDLSDPIVAARGEIHRYVGDELIVTWKLEEGIAEARCVKACFAAMDRLAQRAPAYQREFGAAVTFRAGLHCGPIVTGEMGTIRKEIVFLGDTVNTAARIQDFCRRTGDQVLASADLIDRLVLPPSIVKRSLGDLQLRGKQSAVALYALTKAPATSVTPQRDDERIDSEAVAS